jgi:hypothetical protein
MSGYFQLRSSAIVSEIIDGEAIILDLRSGLYFSAQGAGAIIWDGVVAGFPVAAIAERLQAGFDAESALIESSLESFIGALLSNELIEPATASVQPTANWSIGIPEAKTAFTAPTLNVYGDLQDLAQLDPIHDVAEAGWPNRRTEMPNV